MFFSERPDAVKELDYRCSQVTTISEFLYSGKFISTEKYLEVAEKIDSLNSGKFVSTEKYLKVADKIDSLKIKEKKLWQKNTSRHL